MNVDALRKIKDAIVALLKSNAEKTLIINNYEEAWNDIEKLKLRVNELGKIEQTIKGTGSAFDPFKTWIPGIEVHAGEWWMTENGYLWEAKKDGIPQSDSDKEYWDIIDL